MFIFILKYKSSTEARMAIVKAASLDDAKRIAETEICPGDSKFVKVLSKIPDQQHEMKIIGCPITWNM